jgi:hypothetical protein
MPKSNIERAFGSQQHPPNLHTCFSFEWLGFGYDENHFTIFKIRK